MKAQTRSRFRKGPAVELKPSAARRARPFAMLSVLSGLICVTSGGRAEDWPMPGRDKTRNPVSPERNAPIEWDAKTGRNIKWKAELGSVTVSEPIVSDGLVWIGTNNDPPRDPTLKGPGGVLACLRE